MRYALISDIHANLSALQSVIAEIEQQDCDEIICLGDIVGYGPKPNECLDTVKALTERVILGNHDAAVFDRPEEFSFNPIARNAIRWTRSRISERNLFYLKELPYTLAFDLFFCVHASPCSPQSWHYITSRFDAFKHLDCFTQPVLFIGHTHSAIVYRCRGGLYDTEAIAAGDMDIEARYRYIINVGSVGQPRDGDPRAAFGIFDSDERCYDQIRVEYDIEKTQQAMQKQGLSHFLIERLEHGV